MSKRTHYIHPRLLKPGRNLSYLRSSARAHTICNAWPMARFVTLDLDEVDCRKCLRQLDANKALPTLS